MHLILIVQHYFCFKIMIWGAKIFHEWLGTTSMQFNLGCKQSLFSKTCFKRTLTSVPLVWRGQDFYTVPSIHHACSSLFIENNTPNNRQYLGIWGHRRIYFRLGTRKKCASIRVCCKHTHPCYAINKLFIYYKKKTVSPYIFSGQLSLMVCLICAQLTKYRYSFPFSNNKYSNDRCNLRTNVQNCTSRVHLLFLAFFLSSESRCGARNSTYQVSNVIKLLWLRSPYWCDTAIGIL